MNHLETSRVARGLTQVEAHEGLSLFRDGNPPSVVDAMECWKPGTCHALVIAWWADDKEREQRFRRGRRGVVTG